VRAAWERRVTNGMAVPLTTVSIAESCVLPTWKLQGSLSIMETDELPERPSPLEAAAALEAARQARTAGHTSIQAWLFLVYGLMATVLMLLHPSSGLLTLAVVGTYGVGVVAAEHVYSRRVVAAGVVPRKLTIRQTVAVGAPTAALWIALAFLNETWGWIIGAVVVGCWTAGYALVHSGRARTRA
jgi:hypothetical protein